MQLTIGSGAFILACRSSCANVIAILKKNVSARVNVAFLHNVRYLMFPLLKYICLHAAQNAFDYSISLL